MAGSKSQNRKISKPRREEHAFLLAGEAELERSEAAAEIIRAVLGKAPPQWAVVTFDCSSGVKKGDAGGWSAAEIFDELEQPNLLGSEKKVVRIKNAEELFAKHPEPVGRFLENPVEGVVLLAEVRRMDMRRKVYKLFQQKARVRKFRKLYSTAFGETRASAGSELGAWIADRGKKKGLRLTAGAVEALLGLAGEDMYALENHLEKMALGRDSKENSPVTESDVAGMVSGEAGEFVFALADHVLQGEVSGAVSAASEMFERGSVNAKGRKTISPDSLIQTSLAIIYSKLERLETAARARRNGADLADALAVAGVNRRSPMYPGMEKMLPKWTLRLISTAFELLFNADYGAKSGRMASRAAFDETVLRIARLAARK